MEQRSDCPHCNDSRSRFYQRDTPTGTLQYCHNCGYKNFIPTKNRTPSQTVEFIKRYVVGDEENNLVKDIKLPFDFSPSLPTPAKLWLKKYGIRDDEIQMFGFGWSERAQRLILPVFSGEELIYYQGRTFKEITKDNPKYRNLRKSGARNKFFFRGWDGKTKIDRLCIVEDILSAVKVGRHVPSLALLGSYFPVELNPLYRLCSSVYIWLDQDKYLTAIKEATKINNLYGIPVRVVSTTYDPKENSDGQITELILGGMS